MRSNKWWLMAILLLIAALALAACQPAGGEEEVTEEPTEAVEPTEDMTEAPEPTEEMTAEPTEEMTTEATEAAEGEIDCKGANPGDEVTLLYQWSGQEEERWTQIIQPVVDACGIVLAPESTREQGILDTRVESGTPPDIAFWNLPQVAQYQDQIIPLSELGVNDANYQQYWMDQATFNGEWLALPVKADIKTIIWYNPANFAALGYEVPETWEDLDALVEQMVADGYVPWSMGLESGDATGWTGSDFIQDILLVQQGPEYVMGLLSGEIPYNDAGVAQAYETYGRWASDPTYTVGGAEGTLATPFLEAIYLPFEDPPQAMMVKQSGFAGGEISTQFPDLVYGEDYDFFGVPGAQGVQGGADWMFAFSDEPAVQAIFAYLSSDAGGVAWAETGFDLTPNQAGFTSYTDVQLQKKADILASATGFTPDIGDSIPGGFGSAEWAAIIAYLQGGDLQAALDEAAEVQAEALGE